MLPKLTNFQDLTNRSYLIRECQPNTIEAWKIGILKNATTTENIFKISKEF